MFSCGLIFVSQNNEVQPLSVWLTLGNFKQSLRIGLGHNRSHMHYKNAMIRELCGSNRFTLTENKRSDPPLFDFIQSLKPGTPEAKPLAEALAEARQQFPKTNRDADRILCLSHQKRMTLNKLMNMRKKTKDAVFFRYLPTHGGMTGNQPQSVWL